MGIETDDLMEESSYQISLCVFILLEEKLFPRRCRRSVGYVSCLRASTWSALGVHLDPRRLEMTKVQDLMELMISLRFLGDASGHETRLRKSLTIKNKWEHRYETCTACKHT